MPEIDKNAIIYTMLAQGAPACSPNFRGVDLNMARVWNEVSDPMHVGQHWDVQGCNDLPDSSIIFSDATAVANYPLTTIGVCDPPISGIASIKAQGNGADSIYPIKAYDANGNALDQYGSSGCGINFTEYHQWGLVSTSPDTYTPLALVPCSFIDPFDNQTYFNWSLLCGVGAFAKYLYHVPFDWVMIGYNHTIWELWAALLDGYLADTQQIAPSGGEGGGGGIYSRPDEEVPIPPLPSISICDSGFVALYSVSQNDMQQLATYLWDSNFFNNIIKNFASPFDNIVAFQEIPFTPSNLTAANIIFGNVDTGISAYKYSTSFFELDFGSINVSNYYKTFADYAPYTKIQLYLPYIGIVPINPDDVMDGIINVVYHIDVFSGACVAYIYCKNTGKWHVLNQYSGNILNEFPITGANYTNMYIGQMSGAVGAIGGVASMNPGAVMNGISQMISSKPEYQRSGGIGSTAGLMSVQNPYLIFSTPQYIVADNFRDVKGHTSNLKVTVGNETGFLQAEEDNSELSSIGCTKEEEDMIRTLLKEGIYI